MQSTDLKITGMTCNHCVAAVMRALKAVPGVAAAEVTLESGRALVTGTADPAILIRAIEQEGYQARLEHRPPG